MDRLRQAVDAARVAFERLSQREQFMVAGGAAGSSLLILVLIGYLVNGAITSVQHRVQVKTKDLIGVLSLEGEYRTRQQERTERLATLGRSNVRLVSLVEDSAKQAGIEIGQLRPEEGEPSGDGVVESRVDLRASGLSADRLQDFVNRLEASPGIVIIRRLKISRPYRRDTGDVEMTISTFKLKS